MKLQSIIKWSLFGVLYFTQYIGFAFLSVAIIAILRQGGVSMVKIGMISLFAIPYSVRFLWAPFVDKYGSKKIGHYKGWLLISQTLMAIALLLSAFTNPINQFELLSVFLILFILSCATQDITIDGLACKVFTKKERSKINGLQVTAGMLGSLFGGGLMLMIYPQLQWKGCLLILGVITLLSVIIVSLYKEPLHKKQEDSEDKSNPFLRIFTFWKTQKRWLLALILYAFGLGVIYAFITPTLVDIGWELPKIGFALQTIGPALGVVSGLASGWIIKKIGSYKTTAYFFILKGISTLLFLPAVIGISNDLYVYGFIILHFLCFSPLLASTATIMMEKSANSNTPSTDFTIQNSVLMLVSYLFTGVSLALSDFLGSVTMVSLGILVTLLSGILTLFLFKKQL